MRLIAVNECASICCRFFLFKKIQKLARAEKGSQTRALFFLILLVAQLLLRTDSLVGSFNFVHRVCVCCVWCVCVFSVSSEFRLNRVWYLVQGQFVHKLSGTNADC